MRFLLLLFPLFVFTSCIGDDIVDDYVKPEIRVQNPVSSIEAGTSYQFMFQFVNNVGQEEQVNPSWQSADPAILSIDASGLAMALVEGTTSVTLSYQDEFGETASTTEPVEVGASTVVVEPTLRMGTIATTSSYELTGSFELSELPNGSLKLALAGNYVADDGLPGLYVYLSNNPNSRSGALEIGPVTVFQGAHEYVITGAQLDQYAYVLYFCKPFNVKVGHGDIE